MLRQEENIKLKEKGHYIGVESEKHKCKNIWKQKKNIKKKEFQMYTCLQKQNTEEVKKENMISFFRRFA